MASVMQTSNVMVAGPAMLMNDISNYQGMCTSSDSLVATISDGGRYHATGVWQDILWRFWVLPSLFISTS
jgi:hypothetical protein